MVCVMCPNKMMCQLKSFTLIINKIKVIQIITRDTYTFRVERMLHY